MQNQPNRWVKKQKHYNCSPVENFKCSPTYITGNNSVKSLRGNSGQWSPHGRSSVHTNLFSSTHTREKLISLLIILQSSFSFSLFSPHYLAKIILFITVHHKFNPRFGFQWCMWGSIFEYLYSATVYYGAVAFSIN